MIHNATRFGLAALLLFELSALATGTMLGRRTDHTLAAHAIR